MQRYVNPHPTMYPQQQQMPQQQMPQQQMPQVVMTAQGPMMVTPQGLMPIPMQQQPMQQQFPQQGMGMMAMHGGMQPQQFQQPQQQYVPQQQFQPQNNQSVVQSRFGQPTATMDMMTTQAPESNRYGTPQPQQQPQQQQFQPQQQQVEEPTGPLLFIVTPVVHKFAGNEKFKMNVITEAVKPNSVDYEEGFLACSCLEENVEALVEVANKPDTPPMVTVRNFIINNNFYHVDLTQIITDMLAGGIKDLYKIFKANYSKMTDIHQINVLNVLNTNLTDVINDFLTVNATVMISIESFYTDFNDLLKVIRNTEEDLEELLLDYLNQYVDSMKVASTNTKTAPNTTHLNESLSLAYLNRHVLETGLEELTNQFVQVDESIANNFIKSLVAEVVVKVAKQEFLLVTLDKSIFKFMITTADEAVSIFVKKIA